VCVCVCVCVCINAIIVMCVCVCVCVCVYIIQVGSGSISSHYPRYTVDVTRFTATVGFRPSTCRCAVCNSFIYRITPAATLPDADRAALFTLLRLTFCAGGLPLPLLTITWFTTGDHIGYSRTLLRFYMLCIP